jgi:hypothetical protein
VEGTDAAVRDGSAAGGERLRLAVCASVTRQARAASAGEGLGGRMAGWEGQRRVLEFGESMAGRQDEAGWRADVAGTGLHATLSGVPLSSRCARSTTMNPYARSESRAIYPRAVFISLSRPVRLFSFSRPDVIVFDETQPDQQGRCAAYTSGR